MQLTLPTRAMEIITIGSVVFGSILTDSTTASLPSSDGEVIRRASLGEKIDDCLTRLVPFGFSGAVLVAKDGEVILRNGYGLADRGAKRTVTSETVFDIGSITKQFTGAAVLKLEMQGKLSVQDSIAKYFKDVPGDKSGITLHHLLTHSSGLEGDFGGDYDSMSRDGIIEAALKSELRWPPGTRYAYSNAGYSLLGAIVEIVSGVSYEAFIREHLLLPAGMKQTGYRLPAWPREQLARGYSSGTDYGTPLDHAWSTDGPYWNLRCNGGILATVTDMYRWHLALAGDTVLDSEAKRKYQSPHMPEGPQADSHYGYGWSIAKTPRNTTLITHNGGSSFGFHADFRRYVDENIVVFIATNGDLRASQVDQQIARILFGMDYTLPPKAVEVQSTLLAAYGGTYETPTGAKLKVVAKEGCLGVFPANETAMWLLFSVSEPQQSEYSRRSEAAGIALEALVKGDYLPIHRALKNNGPVEETKTRYEPHRRGLEEELGPMKGAQIQGTHGQNDRLFTDALLFFERGTRRIQCVWDGDRLLGLRLEVPDSELIYVPESPTEFSGYRLNAPPTAKLSFRFSGHGGSTLMTIRGQQGETIARKTE